MTLTAHCIIKNEERWIEACLTSVLPFVNSISVYDTGSTDSTVSIVRRLAAQYPEKIVFEEKGACDKRRHTALRQEMIEKTTTDWFMILDGDEVWTNRALEEAVQKMQEDSTRECLIAPFHLCVGDVCHETTRPGQIQMLGKTDYFYPRFFKKTPGIHWSGDYNNDVVKNGVGEIVFEKRPTHILTERFWHLTHLRRSQRDDTEYSSGGTRGEKRVPTYVGIGKAIAEPVPEALARVPGARLTFALALLYTPWWLLGKSGRAIAGNVVAKKMYRGWMKFGHFLGTINGFIILGIIYTVAIGVYALIQTLIRMFTRTPLEQSYWQEKATDRNTLDEAHFQF